jgi:predicted membrane protein (TIGR00267 family)
MSIRHWLASPHNRLDIVAGVIDGMLTALTLAAGTLFNKGGALSLALVGKVAVFSACTTVFVFFVAHYTELRSELVRSERELNLLSHGRLATTRLGQQVRREALLGSLVASLCSLIGAAIPLLLGLLLPGLPVLSVALAVGLLGGLGALLAMSLFGSPLVWAIGMMLGGIALTLIGVNLDIAG